MVPHHHHHHPVALTPTASLLRISAWQRLAMCAVLIAVLWAAVALVLG
ncbi:conserved hypothetical protein [Chelatococcus asaccharovorans]|nr:hypothetical protein [Chelatococcus asaccharovorans]CAH1648653.1 conserved hypothetical protein [Chelatococcus asaccharovorans]CAH1687505.1 conserved hypothetical protein [Chelatococcus asaccharovorans]